jgi:23S rRNA pseudouridine1911/1915/1917 synthase
VSETGQFVVRLIVPDEEGGERLDRVVTSRLADTSRSYVQRLIEQGDVLVNGAPARPSTKVAIGDEVEVRVPLPDEPEELTPADILIPIAYEDDDLIVFDKPPGLVVHPAPGHEHGTLANVFKWLRPDSVPQDNLRPGIVHRLDKDTSGLIVVAKTEESRLHLLRQWQQRLVLKEYTALVVGQLPEDRATVDAPITRDPNNRRRMAVLPGGRPAVSHLSVVTRYPAYSLLNVRIETGRTHQIRVHCAFIRHPVAGDRLYGGVTRDLPLQRQFLHARRLRFDLPSGQPLELESPLPRDLQDVLSFLETRAES